jgi:hypothetical protein
LLLVQQHKSAALRGPRWQFTEATGLVATDGTIDVASTEAEAVSLSGLAASAGDISVSAAFMVNTGHEVCVMSLHDAKAGNISVLVGNQEFKLRAGEELIVTDDCTATLDKANPLKGIGIRDQSEPTVSNGIKAFVCEFSLPSAMMQINTLTSLSHSQHAANRSLYDKMVKNAAALQMLTISKGAYKATR